MSLSNFRQKHIFSNYLAPNHSQILVHGLFEAYLENNIWVKNTKKLKSGPKLPCSGIFSGKHFFNNYWPYNQMLCKG